MECEKPNILTPEAAAKEAGVCLKTLYKVMRMGQLRHCKAGDRYLITRANFEQWLSGQCDRAKTGAC